MYRRPVSTAHRHNKNRSTRSTSKTNGPSIEISQKRLQNITVSSFQCHWHTYHQKGEHLLWNLLLFKCSQFWLRDCNSGNADSIKPTKVEDRQRGTKVELVKKLQVKVCGPRGKWISASLCPSVSRRNCTSLIMDQKGTKIPLYMPMCPYCTALCLFKSVSIRNNLKYTTHV